MTTVVKVTTVQVLLDGVRVRYRERNEKRRRGEQNIREQKVQLSEFVVTSVAYVNRITQTRLNPESRKLRYWSCFRLIRAY